MNKRQIKKRYKRINGQNPPKHFTVSQMRKCSTNSELNNKLHIMACIIGNNVKKVSNAIIAVANRLNALKAAKMLGIDLEAEANREVDETQELYIKQEQYISQERTLLGDLGI